jgi:hypothetical protein
MAVLSVGRLLGNETNAVPMLIALIGFILHYYTFFLLFLAILGSEFRPQTY